MQPPEREPYRFHEISAFLSKHPSRTAVLKRLGMDSKSERFRCYPPDLCCIVDLCHLLILGSPGLDPQFNLKIPKVFSKVIKWYDDQGDPDDLLRVGLATIGELKLTTYTLLGNADILATQ